MNVTVEQLHRALGGEITRGKTGPQVLCPGPGHSAKDRSLAVAPGDSDDGFVVYSFAGDDPIKCKDHVRNKLRLPLFGSKSRDEQRVIATYDYFDESGTLLYQVLRFEPKDFRQRRPDGAGRWLWKLDGVRRIPYRLPELVEALANERPVFVVEGEKDVDALATINVPATCNPHGAGKWRDEYAEHFKGATVYVIPDNDEPGRVHAQQVADSLKRAGAAPKIVALPGLLPHGDVSDWLKAGGTAEQLYELANSSEAAESATPRGPRLLNSAAFVDGFVPPDYLVEGVLQRRFIYAITGRTGEGKTTVCLRIAAHVAEGLSPTQTAGHYNETRRALHLVTGG